MAGGGVDGQYIVIFGYNSAKNICIQDLSWISPANAPHCYAFVHCIFKKRNRLLGKI